MALIAFLWASCCQFVIVIWHPSERYPGRGLISNAFVKI
jgi:hypothetical protein